MASLRAKRRKIKRRAHEQRSSLIASDQLKRKARTTVERVAEKEGEENSEFRVASSVVSLNLQGWSYAGRAGSAGLRKTSDLSYSAAVKGLRKSTGKLTATMNSFHTKTKTMTTKTAKLLHRRNRQLNYLVGHKKITPGKALARRSQIIAKELSTLAIKTSGTLTYTFVLALLNTIRIAANILALIVAMLVKFILSLSWIAIAIIIIIVCVLFSAATTSHSDTFTLETTDNFFVRDVSMTSYMHDKNQYWIDTIYADALSKNCSEVIFSGFPENTPGVDWEYCLAVFSVATQGRYNTGDTIKEEDVLLLDTVFGIFSGYSATQVTEQDILYNETTMCRISLSATENEDTTEDGTENQEPGILFVSYIAPEMDEVYELLDFDGGMIEDCNAQLLTIDTVRLTPTPTMTPSPTPYTQPTIEPQAQ